MAKHAKTADEIDLTQIKERQRWDPIAHVPSSSLTKVLALQKDYLSFVRLLQIGKFIRLDKRDELYDEAGARTNNEIQCGIIGEVSGDAITWRWVRSVGTDADARAYSTQLNYAADLFKNTLDSCPI